MCWQLLALRQLWAVLQLWVLVQLWAMRQLWVQLGAAFSAGEVVRCFTLLSLACFALPECLPC